MRDVDSVNYLKRLEVLFKKLPLVKRWPRKPSELTILLDAHEKREEEKIDRATQAFEFTVPTKILNRLPNFSDELLVGLGRHYLEHAKQTGAASKLATAVADFAFIVGQVVERQRSKESACDRPEREHPAERIAFAIWFELRTSQWTEATKKRRELSSQGGASIPFPRWEEFEPSVADVVSAMTKSEAWRKTENGESPQRLRGRGQMNVRTLQNHLHQWIPQWKNREWPRFD